MGTIKVGKKPGNSRCWVVNATAVSVGNLVRLVGVSKLQIVEESNGENCHS